MSDKTESKYESDRDYKKIELAKWTDSDAEEEEEEPCYSFDVFEGYIVLYYGTDYSKDWRCILSIDDIKSQLQQDSPFKTYWMEEMKRVKFIKIKREQDEITIAVGLLTSTGILGYDRQVQFVLDLKSGLITGVLIESKKDEPKLLWKLKQGRYRKTAMYLDEQKCPRKSDLEVQIELLHKRIDDITKELKTQF